jgi:uncharacterized protein YgiM (DUF1202 family)
MRTKQNKNTTHNTKEKQNWVTFTYIGKEQELPHYIIQKYKHKNTIENKKYNTESPSA